MHGESAASDRATHPPALRLFHKRIAEDLPVTAGSIALFRFGEQCNNDCPMCSNTGEAAVFFHSTEELLRREQRLKHYGFQRVVVTGGEATIHPGFWQVIEQLRSDHIRWDINTHGRSFARPEFARRATERGLERAIVSLHSHRPADSAAIFGSSERAHHETVAGIEQLIACDREVLINCVLTRLNLGYLDEYLLASRRLFGERASFKFVFPSTVGKGGQWAGIALRYDEVREPVRGLKQLAARLRTRICFESIPNCISGDTASANISRSGFGETHYLDDASGEQLYSIRHIEAELAAYGDACRRCSALPRCSGVARSYATRHGVSELTPFA